MDYIQKDLKWQNLKLNQPTLAVGYNNIIETSQPIKVQGNYNRIVITEPTLCEVEGTMNTVYGKGDVVVLGKWNVASTQKDHTISFERELDLPITIKIDDITYHSGKPYCLLQDPEEGDRVYEVYRYNRVPYLVRDKREINITYTLDRQKGECASESYKGMVLKCEIKNPLSTEWKQGIIDEKNDLWVCQEEDFDFVLQLIKTSYKFVSSRNDSLSEEVLKTVLSTKIMNVYEYCLIAHPCPEGMREFLDTDIFPECREGNYIDLSLVVERLKDRKDDIEKEWQDKSISTFLRSISEEYYE